MAVPPGRGGPPVAQGAGAAGQGVDGLRVVLDRVLVQAWGVGGRGPQVAAPTKKTPQNPHLNKLSFSFGPCWSSIVQIVPMNIMVFGNVGLHQLNACVFKGKMVLGRRPLFGRGANLNQLSKKYPIRLNLLEAICVCMGWTHTCGLHVCVQAKHTHTHTGYTHNILAIYIFIYSMASIPFDAPLPLKEIFGLLKEQGWSKAVNINSVLRIYIYIYL